ncbi:tellurite resistance TerB family protein [Cyanobium sp. FGCU-6]|nr:tellurite resistance TerB family protein [Cyanobium sp. FGCU6]
MTSTLLPTRDAALERRPMDPARAFAAVALAAVSWDGVLTPAGSRALRHTLDYRDPFRGFGDTEMVKLLDALLADLRCHGAQHLMLDAAAALSARQRHTAYAVAAEIMRSDGPLEDDERNILASLACALELPEEETVRVGEVMDVLHAALLDPA